MKAQKVLGIAACAAVCAASSAFAKDETWFDGKVDTTTKDAISTPTAATWTKPAADVQLNAGSISLFNDATDPLVLTPDSVVSKKTDGLVTISGKAVLSPNDALATSGAQAGIAVKTVDGVNTYFGYDGSAWHQLAGVAAPADDAETEFKILLDYRTKKAKFFVGGTLLNEDGTTEFSIAKESVEKISAFGFGTLSALAAEYEVAVAAVDDVRYGSIAEAVKAAANGDGEVQPGKIALVDEEGDAGKPDAVADNGLKQWENAALGIDDDESIPLVPSEKKNEGMITLALAESRRHRSQVRGQQGWRPAGRLL